MFFPEKTRTLMPLTESLQDIYFYPIYKYMALVNELKRLKCYYIVSLFKFYIVNKYHFGWEIHVFLGESSK